MVPTRVEETRRGTLWRGARIFVLHVMKNCERFGGGNGGGVFDTEVLLVIVFAANRKREPAREKKRGIFRKIGWFLFSLQI